MRVITGPTAVGKSRLAMDYATAHDCEIVSADSMQVYRQFDIGTAKPSLLDRQAVPHHCIDIVNPQDDFSVSQWLQHADNAVLDIAKRGKVPLIVGGTGFYIKALLYSHSFGATDIAIRLDLQEQLQQRGADYMHAMLGSLDSQSAKAISPNDTKRVLRALEIYYVTGKPKSHFVSLGLKKRYIFDLQVVQIDRDELYQRINRRVDGMIAGGLVDEVGQLLQYRSCQSMQAIGYKELVPYFDGQANLQYCIDQIKQSSRRFAKRQLTYFRYALEL